MPSLAELLAEKIVGALGPEEAEALTVPQAWRSLKGFGLEELPKNQQVLVGKGLRQLREYVKKVNSIRSMTPKELKDFPDTRGLAYAGNTPEDIALKGTLSAVSTDMPSYRTPIHEVAHFAYQGKVSKMDKDILKEILDTEKSKIATLSDTLGVQLYSPNELFTEGLARLVSSPTGRGIELFPKKVQSIIKKYIPVVAGLAAGGELLTSQQEAEASGLQPPISLTSEEEASGLQPPINLTSQASAQSLGGEIGDLQPPIQLGGPSTLEGLPPRPVVGERPIDLVQRAPGLYALPEEKMKADVARQEAIERGEVLREDPRGLLRRGTEMFLGEGPVQALMHPIDTAKLAAEGYTRPLEELGQEVSKQALGFGLGAGAAKMMTNLGLTGVKLLPRLARSAIEWTAFQLPFAMTGEVTPEEKQIQEEAGVAHAIAFDPSVAGERPNKPGPPSPADVAEDLAWAGAMGAGFGLAGRILKPVLKGAYRAFNWPLNPLKPYWAKVADLAWESHSIPVIAGIGAAGAVAGALTSEEPLEGALKGAGVALGGKALIESGHLPNPLARKLTQVVQGPKGLTTEKVFKTLGETFQPAIERMRKAGGKAGQIAASFRDARVQETFTRNLSQDVQKLTESLLPSERIEFMRGLSSTPLSKLKSPAAQTAVQEINTKIGRLGLQPLYEDEFKKHFGELMAHPLEQAQSSIPLRTIMSYTKQFERKAGLQSGQVTYKQAQGLLDDIVTHPTVNPEMKQLAVQLYDMAAMTPREAAKASHHAMETFLLDKLMKNPGVISPVMKPGFVESVYPKTKGMYVSRDLELELEGMEKIPRFAEDLYQQFFLTPWKTNKVVLRPAAHFRNLMSNIILNDWGGLPFWRQDIYAKSLHEVLKKGPLFKEFTRLTGDTRFATGDEFFRPLANARYGDSLPRTIFRLYDGMVSPARSMYAGEETWAKLSKYIHSRELGMSKVEAAADAVKWCVDDETEALTLEGWKKGSEVKEGDFIWGWDAQYNKCKWVKVEDKFEGEYEGEMISYQNQLVDMLLTPDHRCPVFSIMTGQVRVVLARDLKQGSLLPYTAPSFIPAGATDEASSFFELVGWFISEGSVLQQPYNTYVTIVQKMHKEELLSCLKANGGFYKEGSTYQGCTTFWIQEPLRSKLLSICPDKQLTIDLVMDCSTEQLEGLFKGLMLGDGASTGLGWFQKDNDEREAFTILCTLTGRRGWLATQLKVSVSSTQRGSFHPRYMKKVLYKGKIWCPRTSTGFWVARRNGKSFITGNTFNYQEVTPAIARLRTAWWGAPFATWMSKSIPLTAETAVKHPLRFGKWIALGYYLNGYALDQIGMSKEEWEGMKKVMPDYVSKSLMLMLPYRGSEGELKMLNLTWMIPGIGDLAEIKQRGEESPGSLATIAFQNPVGNILAAWKLNKKFGGAPIWYDWESYPTQAAKMLNYGWQQWAPAVVPGGADWKAVYSALTEAPEAPSPEEALASQFGLRVTTISPEAAYRKKAALDKIHRAEIMQEMRRQLRFATSPEEQEDIVKGAQENLTRLTGEEEED